MPRLPTFTVPTFTLDPLNVPSSRGLFPWKTSEGFGPSSFNAPSAPPENLNPPEPLAPERAKQRLDSRRRTMMYWLASMPGNATLGAPELDEIRQLWPNIHDTLPASPWVEDVLGRLMAP